MNSDMHIGKDETLIEGGWIVKEGKPEADANTRRIEALIHGYLTKVGADTSGWDILYQDPSDGRCWELIFPQSTLHGGGPPTLRWISRADAELKYGESLGAKKEK